MSYTWMPLSGTTGLTDLKNHIPEQYDPARVAVRLAAGMSAGVKSVLIESQYIDKDYRCTFYNFYAKKGQQYDADCARLHFFDDAVTFDPTALRLACPEGPECLLTTTSGT